jgi:flagellar biosynthetic protein FliR
MTLDYQTMIRTVSLVFWPMARITGLMLSLPVLSSNLISGRIKVFYILSLSWVCSFLVPEQLSLEHFNGLYVVYVIQEVCFGAIMGFVMQLVFQVFILGGQVISLQAGLGFAIMVDPTSKASVPWVGQLYLMMMTLMFLALNGHLVVLEALIESFKITPIGSMVIDENLVGRVLSLSGWMFKEAVLISMPAIISLLLVNLAFGIMSRVAPQLNVFSLGFPITLLMAIVIIYVCMGNIGAHMIGGIEQGMHLILGMVRHG